MEGGKKMLSKGKVQTIINGKMIQDKEYGLKYVNLYGILLKQPIKNCKRVFSFGQNVQGF